MVLESVFSLRQRYREGKKHAGRIRTISDLNQGVVLVCVGGIVEIYEAVGAA